MIGLSLGPEPDVLVANGETWTQQYVEWLESKVGPEPRHYAHDDIRDGLRDETASKCAYCEGLVNDVSYDHIEHMKPKKKNPELVCKWDNLTIACPRCNTNKGDFDSADCPLLNPYVDDAEAGISFYGPFALPRGGPRSRMTITELDLNRKDLLFARGQVIERLDTLLDLIERAAGDNALEEALWADVDRLAASDAEFASAARYFLGAECDSRGLTRP